MMNCLVCGTPLNNKENDCQRCGFHYLNSAGGSFEDNFDLQRSRADIYRDKTFLPRFKLGVNCHRWKDENGELTEVARECLPIAGADELMKGTVWLEQPFARPPEGKPLAVDICVMEEDAPARTIRFDMPLVLEPDLLQLGLHLEEKWHMEDGRRVEDGPVLRLKVKTVGGGREVESKPVKLIAG